MRNLARWAMPVLGLLVVAQVAAADRPTIAVLDFTAVSKAVAFGEDFSVVAWDENRTNLLTADLVTALVNTRKFDVLERERMNEVIKEKEFISVTTDRAIQLGALLGADYFVLGQIERIEASKKTKRIPYSELVKITSVGRMTVNVRIVDTRGGKIVAAQKVTARHSVQGGDVSALDFIERLKDQTVQDLVNCIVEGVFPIRIIEIEGNEVFLNRGEGAPFEPGNIMKVCSLGKELIDPDTGESLGSAEVEVGRIEITEIQKKFSKGVIISDSPEAVQKDMVVRLVHDEPAPVQPRREVTPGSSEKPVQW